MKKLIFIAIAIVLMAAALPVATGWLNYSGAKNYAMWTTKWLQADQVFYWQGDTIKKDSLVYTDLKTDSARFRYIDGSLSPWYYAGKGAYTLPTASATVKGGIKVGTGLSIDAGTGVLSSTGGATNLAYTASSTNGIVTSDTGTDATIPAGSTTNASLMLPADKTKLNGIASGADNYGSWTLNAGGFPTTVPSGYSVNLIEGTNIDISQSGLDVTISSTGGSMVYPGAGIPLSTGSAWGTSITDNSANWNTAYSNRIATFTTTGNSGAATLSGNTLNIPNYTLAGLGGIGEAPTGQVHYRTNTGWVPATLAATYYTNKIELFYTATQYEPLDAATTSLAGVMTSTDKTNLNAFTSNKSNYDAAYTNMGKVTVGGGVAYGDMSSTYFSIIGGAIIPTRDSSPVDGSTLPITSNAVYDALLLKADLSGSAFTGAVTNTSTFTAADFILNSDRRLKKDIKPLKNIDWANKIDFVSYRMKADTAQQLRYGVIAQEVEKYAPELVHTDEKGIKSVSYIDLLIVKNQQLQNQINFLKYENGLILLIIFILFFICFRTKRS